MYRQPFRGRHSAEQARSAWFTGPYAYEPPKQERTIASVHSPYHGNSRGNTGIPGLQRGQFNNTSQAYARIVLRGDEEIHQAPIPIAPQDVTSRASVPGRIHGLNDEAPTPSVPLSLASTLTSSATSPTSNNTTPDRIHATGTGMAPEVVNSSLAPGNSDGHANLKQQNKLLQEELLQAKMKISQLQKKAEHYAPYSGERVGDLHKEIALLKSQLIQVAPSQTSAMHAHQLRASYHRAQSVQTDESCLYVNDSLSLTDDVLIRELGVRFREIMRAGDRPRFELLHHAVQEQYRAQTRAGLAAGWLSYDHGEVKSLPQHRSTVDTKASDGHPRPLSPDHDIDIDTQQPASASSVRRTGRTGAASAQHRVSSGPKLTPEERRQRRLEFRLRREALAWRNKQASLTGSTTTLSLSSQKHPAGTDAALAKTRATASAPALLTDSASPDRGPATHAELESPGSRKWLEDGSSSSDMQ